MKRIFDWIKSNKLLTLLFIVVLYLIFSPNIKNPVNYRSNYSNGYEYQAVKTASPGFSAPSLGISALESPPQPNIKDRLVIQESSLSLLVDSVVNVQKQIIKKAEDLEGYMVNSNLQNPQDIASATVIIRIPASKLNEALSYFRSLAVKVTSENLQGIDVTDQYVDVQARMDTLIKTKNKFDQILEKATQVQDILNVQREIINIQSQIDALKGQKDYLKKNAEVAKLTIYLSTDEFALPYTPTESWRPNVIFKEAVRSLVSTFRKVGSLAIWSVVYSVIWVPIILVIIYFKRRKKV